MDHRHSLSLGVSAAFILLFNMLMGNLDNTMVDNVGRKDMGVVT